MKKILLTFPIFFIFLLFFLPFVQSEERSVKVKPKEKRDLSVEAKKGLDTTLLNAKYHAIIIGNNNYKNLPKLKTAIADAKSVDELLKNQYGFETKLLLDATRNEILTTVNDFRKRLGSKDNLLIYYAGHGEFDKTADRAYWLPVNAQRDDPVDWISATDITDNIKRIASAHILIISDSCYSGTLTRAAAGDLSTKGERDEFVKKMMERKSRTLMASGGNEPVADEGGSGHSVFADSLLRALKEADRGIFTAEELFHGRVKSSVAGKSDQVPEYNDIKNSGHDGGDFVFKLASLSSDKEDVTPEINSGQALSLSKGQKGSPSPEVSEEMKRLEEEKERLKSEREELEQKKALMEEKNRLEEERKKLEKEKLEVSRLQPPAKSLQETIRSSDGRYIDNGDGTITDTRTDLMWAKKDSYADLGRCLNWNDSNSYAGNLRTGGYSDWRLPTIAELETIYDGSKDNKDYWGRTIHIDPIFASGSSHWYWSSESATSDGAYAVFFTTKTLKYLWGRYDHFSRVGGCGALGARVVRR